MTSAPLCARPAPTVAVGSAELADLARRLLVAENLPALVDELPRLVPTVLGAEHASVTVVDRGAVPAVAATDDRARRLVEGQQRTGEGPVLDALQGLADAVTVTDLATESRWPRWRSVASADRIATPVGSLVSFRLDVGRNVVACLTVHSSRPRAFDEPVVTTGSVLAAHAAVAMEAVAKRDNLRLALESRDTIGQAKGILMERFRITSEEAFALLIGASQRTNRKLRDVADHLTTTGEFVVERAARS